MINNYGSQLSIEGLVSIEEYDEDDYGEVIVEEAEEVDPPGWSYGKLEKNGTISYDVFELH